MAPPKQGSGRRRGFHGLHAFSPADGGLSPNGSPFGGRDRSRNPGQRGVPATKSAAEPSPVHNVFIPTDAQEKPTGDKWYVPEGLFGQLQRLAAARSNPPQGW